METSNELYDKWHEEIARREEDHDDGPWHLMAKSQIGDIKGKRVLEIGCGRGAFSKYLLSCGADLVAADFSSSAIDIAKRLLADSPPCDIRVADIQNIPFGDNEFDLVISLETLEHVPDWKKGLSELVRVTKPDGQLVITTPNYFGGQGLYRAYRNLTGRPFTEVGQPINNPLTLKDRVRNLKKLGCHVKIVDGCGHYLYLPGHNPIRLHWLDNPRFIMKWFSAHALTVSSKGPERKN